MRRPGSLLKMSLAAVALAAGLAAATPLAANAASNAPAEVQVVSAPAVAAKTPPQFSCGWFTCSFEFTRSQTNVIAGGGATGARLCSKIPTPGNIFCSIGLLALVADANLAKAHHECAVVNFTKTPPPLGTWWPSVDNSSRCRN